MRRCFIAFAISIMACADLSGQGLETMLTLNGAGIRPLHHEVVRISAKDQGALFGGSSAGFQLQLSRPLTKWLALRADVGYLYEQHRFELPCMCVTTFDRMVVFDNSLTINAANLLVGGEWRTPHEQYWYTSLQVGIEAIAMARRNVEYAISFPGQQPDTTEALVTDERYPLHSGWGAFVPQLHLGLGRQFWKRHPARLELFFLQDLSELTYGIKSMPGRWSQQVQFRRTSIGIRFGVHLAFGPKAVTDRE